MKTLIFVVILMFGAFTANAQSTNQENYKQVFTIGTTPYFVDSTSLQIVKNGNKVFWALFPYSGHIAVVSVEVNCSIKKMRARSTFFIINGQASNPDNDITEWFPHNDPLANKYVIFACAPVTRQNLSGIFNSDM